MLKSKKSEAGLVAIIIIIVVLFSLGWLYNINQRECSKNKDCSSESYCGSDFSCHQYPNIQNNIVQYNFFWPALIIGIALIIGAWIFRRVEVREEKEIVQIVKKTEPEEVEEITEPYYKSDSNVKVP